MLTAAMNSMYLEGLIPKNVRKISTTITGPHAKPKAHMMTRKVFAALVLMREA